VRSTGIGLVVAVVLGLLTPAGTAQAVDVRPEWGSVSAQDQTLKAGCRGYRYHYEVTAPRDGDWDLSVSLVNPHGRAIWFGYLYEGANAASGTARFRICRSKVTPGRYRLRALVTVVDGDDEVRGRLPTARFDLRKKQG